MEVATEAGKAALPAVGDDDEPVLTVMAEPVTEEEVVEAVVTEKYVDTRVRGQMEDLETDLGLNEAPPRGKKLSAKQRKEKQLRKMQRKIVRGPLSAGPVSRSSSRACCSAEPGAPYRDGRRQREAVRDRRGAAHARPRPRRARACDEGTAVTPQSLHPGPHAPG
jgi:hypothetical protein